MIKPASLRAAIVRAIPSLAANPDKLTVFIDAGSIAATSARSLSFEYRYTCNVMLLDFAGDSDELFVAIVEWARAYQADLFLNPDERANGITYEVDILDNATADVSVKLQLTESVVVRQADDGTRTIEHVDDSRVAPNTYTLGDASQGWPA
ncbi:phage tail protein [Paraburkholderia acidipaludis]|uniref:phage tail protein n=1 Tax=Paraburkholderia acidipaludis TaxID=660537 RepID=UPI000486E595|nr:phage tail protein [Paraburkholderia acidipaludis]